MPTAESLVALLGGTVHFGQGTFLLNDDAAGEGWYGGTATLVADSANVPDPGSTLLLGISLVGLRAWQKRLWRQPAAR